MGVDRCDADILEPALRRKGLGCLCAEHHGGHRALACQKVLVQRSLGDDRHCVDERQRPRRIGSRDLANRVTEHGRRLDAHRHERVGERGLDREQQWLGDFRIRELPVEFGVGQKVGEDDIRMEPEEGADRGERLTEMQVLAERLDAHACPLRAVA